MTLAPVTMPTHHEPVPWRSGAATRRRGDAPALAPFVLSGGPERSEGRSRRTASNHSPRSLPGGSTP